MDEVDGWTWTNGHGHSVLHCPFIPVHLSIKSTICHDTIPYCLKKKFVND